jgi:hypothetical protein
VINEMEESKLNESWPNWDHSFNIFGKILNTMSSNSVTADRHPADFLTLQLSSESETS